MTEMTVAVTYTIVVTAPAMPLDRGGRPPKRLVDWPVETMQAIDLAVQEYLQSVGDFPEAVEVEVLEHPAWGET